MRTTNVQEEGVCMCVFVCNEARVYLYVMSMYPCDQLFILFRFHACLFPTCNLPHGLLVSPLLKYIQFSAFLVFFFLFFLYPLRRFSVLYL